MKVGLLGPCHPFRGGIAQYTASFYKALVKAGHETLLISFSRLYPALFFPGSSQLDESACPFRVPCEPLLDSMGPRSWKRAASRLAGFRPDVVVVQWWHPFFGPSYSGVVRGLNRQMGARTVFICHNVMPHEQPSIPGVSLVFRMLLERAFALADGFLVHSAPLSDEVRSFRSDVPVVRIFHPAFDFYPPSRQAAPSPASPRLLFFGNIRAYKGLEVFLQALALVKSQMEFQATVAGEFYTNPGACRELADKLRLQEYLVWRDRYIPNEEVAEVFGQADLVVLPYLEATQSGVAPLAYHFQVPVIASDVGGLSEVVGDGKTGYLVPPGDPVALAQAIVRYFGEDRKAEFQANIAAFRANLSWEEVIRKLEMLFEEIRRSTPHALDLGRDE